MTKLPCGLLHKCRLRHQCSQAAAWRHHGRFKTTQHSIAKHDRQTLHIQAMQRAHQHHRQLSNSSQALPCNGAVQLYKRCCTPYPLAVGPQRCLPMYLSAQTNNQKKTHCTCCILVQRQSGLVHAPLHADAGPIYLMVAATGQCRTIAVSSNQQLPL